MPPAWLLPDNIACIFHLPKGKRSYPPHIAKRLFQEHQREHHQSSFHIYTDGSKSERRAGYGIYSLTSEKCSRIPDISSIYTAELHAILEALQIIEDSSFQNSTIFTDSRSSIQGICNIYKYHPITSQIQSKLIELERQDIHIKLCWIPSHVELQGNERADKLAKDSLDQHEISNIAIPHTDFKAEIKIKVKEREAQKWQNIHPNENKLRKIKRDNNDWNVCFPKRRRLEVVLCRLRLGHTRLTHGHLMERRSSNECNYCGDIPLTVEHILCECPQYLNRLACFGRQNPTLEQILGPTSSIDNVVKFLIQNNIFNKL